jgi:hypothetical protein
MPLSQDYSARNESILDRESLHDYLSRLPAAQSASERHFLSHVLFEHYDNFISRFPWFERESFCYQFREVTAEWVEANVRCEYDLSQWNHLYDQPSNDPRRLPFAMKLKKTWPIEPVAFELESPEPNQPQAGVRLFPHHLIEGTHRINYLNRMMADGLISPRSHHRILVLTRAGQE